MTSHFKTCKGCGSDLLLNSDNFYRHKRMKDGFLNHCKICVRIKSRINYRNNIESYNDYEKNKRIRPKNFTKQLTLNTKKWREKNPEKYKAHIILNNKIKKGEIKKENCIICNSTEVQAHHPDYSKPLDVKWLCCKHHRVKHPRGINNDL